MLNSKRLASALLVIGFGAAGGALGPRRIRMTVTELVQELRLDQGKRLAPTSRCARA